MNVHNDPHEKTFRPAAPLRRLTGFALDFLVIAGYLVVLAAIGFGLTRLPEPVPWPDSSAGRDALAFLTTVLPVTLYFTLQEGSKARATWGKRRLALRVVDAQGARLSWARALARSAIKFLPWQLAHTSLFHIPGWPAAPETPSAVVTAGLIASQALVLIFGLSLLIDKHGRTPYDWLAGTIVVENEGTAPAREVA